MGDGNVVMHVRFRVTNIAAGVTGSALLEALTSQLALDDVALVWGSLRKVEDGTQEAEFDLPNEEAELLRGPMSQAKVHIGHSMIIRFYEMFEDDIAPPALDANGRAEPPGYRDLDRPEPQGYRDLGGAPGGVPNPSPTGGPRGWRDLVADPRVQPNGLLAQSQQPMYSGRGPVDPYLGEPYPVDSYLSGRSVGTPQLGNTPPSSARHYITRPIKQSSCCSRWVSPQEEQESAYSDHDGDLHSARHRDRRDDEEQGGCVTQ